jgi:hypothetical protein
VSASTSDAHSWSMSPEPPRVVLERPPSPPSSKSPCEEAEKEAEKEAGESSSPLTASQVRDVVRLFQCKQCSLILRDPITLPCGKSLCKTCLPETHMRTNISYPATENRLQGIKCPFQDCGKDHALGDCGLDVTLKKAIHHVTAEIQAARLAVEGLPMLTGVTARSQWDVAGISSLSSGEEEPLVVKGGKLMAVFTLAEHQKLKYEAEVGYHEELSRSDAPADVSDIDGALLSKLKSSARTEMDCQVCYAIYFDPLTTACGHTFCRSCLHRVLDHSTYCPICRGALSINPLLHQQSCPSNEALTKIIDTFWRDAVQDRRQALAAESIGQDPQCSVPLFVCTLAFPMMPTFLHVFEPRYRLMLRRAMEGDRTFGMVLPQRQRTAADPHFVEMGTLLRIVNVEYFADGRSLIETIGVTRFKITEHALLDGYVVGNISRIDDISLAEEELLEAGETQVPQNDQSRDTAPSRDAAAEGSGETQTSPSPILPRTASDIQKLPTRELFEFATSSVRRFSEQSVSWLAARMLAIYGECPDDPATFPWWFASVLPVKDMEKYKLLATESVRERLKICCNWILEWEASRW